METADRRDGDVLVLLVTIEREEGFLRGEIADVAVPCITHGSEAKDRFIAAIAGAEREFTGRIRMRSKEHTPLHPRGL